jgi:Concanavalin A-like lectin/glucanases superfamily
MPRGHERTPDQRTGESFKSKPMAYPMKGVIFAFFLATLPACEQVLGMGGEYGDLPSSTGAGGVGGSESDAGAGGVGGAESDAAGDGATADVTDGPSDFCDAEDPELAACYPFDDATDLGHDGSSYGNHASTDGVSAAPGVSGTAVARGATSSMTVEDSPSLDVEALTIELWIRPSTLPYDRAGLFDNDGQYGFFLLSSGELRCSAAGEALSSSVRIEIDAWTHVACTYDGAALALYVNGSQVDSMAASGPVSSSSTTGACIGSDSPWGDGFEGELDGLRVWRYARSKQDICRAAGVKDAGACGG